jgi:hypothetical protein
MADIRVAILGARARPGFDTRNVLALNLPVMSYGRTPDQIVGFESRPPSCGVQ